MDAYLIKIIGSDDTNTNQQITEAYKQWPSNIETCVKRASSFKAMKERMNTHPETRDILTRIHTATTALDPLLRDASDGKGRIRPSLI